MKRSSAKPYEGADPYIFISYCHKDRRFVLPMIESLTHEGFRIWYDEGINPGTEWNEVIADHLNRSSLCVAFISENAVASHNCRREINYALLKHTPLLSVFIEKTELTPGMEMQLGANQCIFAYELKDAANPLREIAKTIGIRQCLGEPNPSIEIRTADYYYEEASDDILTPHDAGDEWFLSQQKVPSPEEEPETVFTPDQEPAGFRLISSQDLPRHISVQIDEGASYSIGRFDASVGKKQSDFEFDKRTKAVSRRHAVVKRAQDGYYITDIGSSAGTHVNGERIESHTKRLLISGDKVSFGNAGADYIWECTEGGDPNETILG